MGGEFLGMGVFRLNYLRALVYPLRSPRRFGALLVGMVSYQLLNAVLLVGGGVLISGLAALLVNEGEPWFLPALFGLNLLLMAGALLLFATGTCVLGYIFQAMQGSARGESVPPVVGGWRRLLWDGLRAGLLLVVWQMPYVITVLGGVFAVMRHSSLDSVNFTLQETLADYYGPLLAAFSLTTVIALGFALLLLSYLGMLAVARLGAGCSLFRALSPWGIVRDIRRGFPDWAACHLILLVPGGFLSLFMLATGINVLALPIFGVLLWGLLTLPLTVYVFLMMANLLGQFAGAYSR